MSEPEIGVTAALSLRAYARHRGVSAPAVLRAVRSGRLHASLVLDAKGKAKVADVALADREWEANTDLTKAPGSVKERARRAPAVVEAPIEPLGPVQVEIETGDAHADVVGHLSLSDASALAQEWRAKNLELEYWETSGTLVDAKKLESKLADVFTQCKTRLLGVTTKAKTAIPKLTHADVHLLDAMIREALEDLATLRVGEPA